MDELTRLVEEVEPYIIGITETWTRSDAEFTLPGFGMFRNNRKLRRGGGVFMYINEIIQVCEIHPRLILMKLYGVKFRHTVGKLRLV